MIGPIFYILIANYLFDAMNALKRLYGDDIEIVACRVQKNNLQRFLHTPWDWPENWDVQMNLGNCN